MFREFEYWRMKMRRTGCASNLTKRVPFFLCTTFKRCVRVTLLYQFINSSDRLLRAHVWLRTEERQMRLTFGHVAYHAALNLMKCICRIYWTVYILYIKQTYRYVELTYWTCILNFVKCIHSKNLNMYIELDKIYYILFMLYFILFILFFILYYIIYIIFYFIIILFILFFIILYYFLLFFIITLFILFYLLYYILYFYLHYICMYTSNPIKCIHCVYQTWWNVYLTRTKYVHCNCAHWNIFAFK